MRRFVFPLVLTLACATPASERMAATEPERTSLIHTEPGGAVPLDAPEVARARTAVKQYKQRLMKALMAALDDGPVAAVSVCREEAPAIAREVSEGGLTVGRVSDRPRNPENTPSAWVAPLLAELKDLPQEAAAPRAVRLGDDAVGYVEPIYVGGPCLRCHGSGLAPDLTAHLQRLYPDDQATGYEAGDFRGLFWVEVR